MSDSLATLRKKLSRRDEAIALSWWFREGAMAQLLLSGKAASQEEINELVEQQADEVEKLLTLRDEHPHKWAGTMQLINFQREMLPAKEVDISSKALLGTVLKLTQNPNSSLAFSCKGLLGGSASSQA